MDRQTRYFPRTERRRRKKGSTCKEREISKGLPVHLPSHSMNTSEKELSVEIWLCSSLRPYSSWLPSVSILLNVIAMFTHLSGYFFSFFKNLWYIFSNFIWIGEWSVMVLQHRSVASCFRQPNQEQSLPLVGSFKLFKLNKQGLGHLSWFRLKNLSPNYDRVLVKLT